MKRSFAFTQESYQWMQTVRCGAAGAQGALHRVKWWATANRLALPVPGDAKHRRWIKPH